MTPAILFDMNGVLIDDEDLHQRAFQQAAREAGLTLIADDYRTFFAGRTDHEGFRAFLTQRAPTRLGDTDDLLAEKARAYGSLAETALRPYPGAAELVLDLCRGGHKLALVTGSTSKEAATVLRFLHLDDAFDAIVTAESTPKGKPSPMPYLAAARLLRRPPRQCVVIEDAPSGIASAKAAGMRCVAVTSTHPPHRLAQANLLVGSLADLTSATLTAWSNR